MIKSTAILVSLLLIAILSVTGSPTASRSSTCQFKSRTAKAFQPILLNAFGGLIVPHADQEDGSWFFDIPAESSSHVRLSCFGEGNGFKLFRNRQTLSGRCDSNGLFQMEYGSMPFDHLMCVGVQAATINRNGTCYNGYTNVDVTPEGTNNKYISICHDEKTSDTFYVEHEIDGPRLSQSESINRPSFAEGGFYPDIEADKCYTSAEQIKTIAILLKSQALADKYVQASKNLFLARGHLSPNGDGITGSDKRSTFFFVNVVPQWQTFNGGNWERLESAARSYAGAKNVVLKVFTGVYGVSTLNDVDGNPVEIYLGKDSSGKLLQKLSVPRLMWKVLYDPKQKTCAAIVQVNNPYEEYLSAADKTLCTSKCSEMPWVNWSTSDSRLGYTLCCECSDLAKKVPWAPKLGDGLGILKY